MIPWRQPVENDDSGLISASSWTAASHWAALNQEAVWLFASTCIHLLACIVGQIRTSARNHILKPHLSSNISRLLQIITIHTHQVTPPHKLPRWSDTWEIWVHNFSIYTKYTKWPFPSLTLTSNGFFDVCWCYSHPFHEPPHQADRGPNAMISGERWSDERIPGSWLQMFDFGDQKIRSPPNFNHFSSLLWCRRKQREE